jgi:S1-C subfamily serine protease
MRKEDMKRSAPVLLFSSIILLTTLACSLGVPSVRPESPAPTVEAILPSDPTAPQQPSNFSGQQADLTALYEKVNPGVVAIQITTDQGGAQGSGFVYDKDGNIITNFHMVDGAKDIEVDFPSGFKSHGKVVGTDIDSDLAVVKVTAPADQLDPLPLGSGEALKVGETVVAIGNPFGLSGSMTVGIVSAKDRTLDSMRESPTGGFFSAGAVIQTDAAINPGNSGGPLLNLQGEVVGVNRAIRTDTTNTQGEPTNSGIGFAVNVDIVKRVVPALIATGKYDYPYLGISSLPELSLAAQEALKLPQSTGAYVTDVRPNSPAAKAGVIAASGTSQLPTGGDLIIAVDGHNVRVFGDLLTYLMTQKSPGDSVVFTILRGTDRKEVTVVLGKRP